MVRTIQEPMPTPARRRVLGERDDNTIGPSPTRNNHKIFSGKAKKRDTFALRIAADEDDGTMLLDEQPPSSVAGLTDTEEEANRTPVARSKGKAVFRQGGIPTPESSQVLPSSTKSGHSLTPTASRFPLHSGQSTATPQKTQTRVRQRPSPTPPRANSLALSSVAPEPSPNPRQKKNPRISPPPDSQPADLSSTFAIVLEPKTSQGKKRASLESQAESSGLSSTGKGKGKIRPGFSASQPTSRARKERLSLSLPSTAPTSRRKSSSPSQSKISAKARKSYAATSRASLGDNGDMLQRRRRQTLTPAVLSRLAGQKVVIGDMAEPLTSQGEDPLLLAPDWDLGLPDVLGSKRGKGNSRASTPSIPPDMRKGAARSGTPSTARIVKAFPFKPYDPRSNKLYEREGSALGLPKTVRRKRTKHSPLAADDDADLGGYADDGTPMDEAGFASDSDDEGAYDDTFLNAMAKRGGPSSGRQIVLLAGQESEEENGFMGAMHRSHLTQSPPVCPSHRSPVPDSAPMPAPAELPSSVLASDSAVESPVFSLRKTLASRRSRYELSESEAEDDQVIYPWTARTSPVLPNDRPDPSALEEPTQAVLLANGSIVASVDGSNADKQVDEALLQPVEESTADVTLEIDNSLGSISSDGSGNEIQQQVSDMNEETANNNAERESSPLSHHLHRIIVQTADKDGSLMVAEAPPNAGACRQNAKATPLGPLPGAYMAEGRENSFSVGGLGVEDALQASPGEQPTQIEGQMMREQGSNGQIPQFDDDSSDWSGSTPPPATNTEIASGGSRPSAEPTNEAMLDTTGLGGTGATIANSLLNAPLSLGNGDSASTEPVETGSPVRSELATTHAPLKEALAVTPDAGHAQVQALVQNEREDPHESEQDDLQLQQPTPVAAAPPISQIAVPASVGAGSNNSADTHGQSSTPDPLTTAAMAASVQVEELSAVSDLRDAATTRTPIIQRIRRSLHAGSTPYLSRPIVRTEDSASAVVPDAQDDAETEVHGSADEENLAEEEAYINTPTKPVQALHQEASKAHAEERGSEIAPSTMTIDSPRRGQNDSLFFETAWQGHSDHEAEQEGPSTTSTQQLPDVMETGGMRAKSLAEDEEDMASMSDAAIDAEWDSLLRKSGCAELYRAALRVSDVKDPQSSAASLSLEPEARRDDAEAVQTLGTEEDPIKPVSPAYVPQAVEMLVSALPNAAEGARVTPLCETQNTRPGSPQPPQSPRLPVPVLSSANLALSQAMSASGLDMTESDSHVGDLSLAETVIADQSFDFSDESFEAANDDDTSTPNEDSMLQIAAQADEQNEDQGENSDMRPSSVESGLPSEARSPRHDAAYTASIITGAAAASASTEEAVDSAAPISSLDNATTQPIDNPTTTPMFSPVALPSTLPTIAEASREGSAAEAASSNADEECETAIAAPHSDAADVAQTEAVNLDVDADTSTVSTGTVLPKGKIILKVLDFGRTFKREPDDAIPPLPEISTIATPRKLDQVVFSTTPVATPPSIAFAWGPSSYPARACPEGDIVDGQTNIHAPTASTPSVSSTSARVLGAPSVGPQPTPCQSSAPPALPPTAILSASARGPAFNQPNRPLAPSRLADMTGPKPDSSPSCHPEASETGDDDTAADEDASEHGERQPDKLSPRQELDLGLADDFFNIQMSTSSQRSVLHEIVRAEGRSAAERLKHVVEISSLDPVAAARATAILKMNYDYVEHGLLSSSGSSQHALTLPSRQSNKEELLYQAELELASRADTPASRRFRESTAFSTVTNCTSLPVPGAWVSTPNVKRKRDIQRAAEKDCEEESGEAWGISDWKRLEKVHRQEKDAWRKEREIKPLPTGGFLGWAKRSLSRSQAPASPVTLPWDPRRVVNAFVEAEKRKGREWDVETLKIRVKALEKRVDEKLARPRQLEETSPSKRLKTVTQSVVPETPARIPSALPVTQASSVTRVMSWVWGSRHTPSATDPRQRVDEDVAQPLMRQNCKQISIVQRQTGIAPMPSALAAQDEMLGSSLLGLSTSSSATSMTAPLDTPAATSRLYPSLRPSISQRSTAIQALFPGIHPLGESTSSADLGASRSISKDLTPGEVVKRKASVKDMVRGFEQSGKLGELLNSRRV